MFIQQNEMLSEKKFWNPLVLAKNKNHYVPKYPHMGINLSVPPRNRVQYLLQTEDGVKWTHRHCSLCPRDITKIPLQAESGCISIEYI